ncbi:hypothetical protein K0504_03565 [Neiella marina]|uniref:Uncharacterized protein n=1 Tax=Neiella holothuriorum TaxID=2870530 RepID=A0ABS7EDU9_9GAMM|nr:hypothetical protein [Neiella holothuriorum]MBW8190103.1 hypothetical protein [Neiella holothuriorum]
MNRAEFFEVISHKFGRWYAIALIAALVTLVAIRLINSGALQNMSLVVFTPVVPAFICMIISAGMRVFDLHKYFYNGSGTYQRPAFMSLKLIPYSIVVAVVSLVPPTILISVLFGLDGHEQIHTSLFSDLLLISSLVFWFFWVVNPYIKRLVGL